MADVSPAPKKPSALMGLIKAVGIVSLLVVIEMVAAAMLIPSAEQTEALARDLADAARGEDAVDHGGESESGPEAEKTVEVTLLKSNSITRFNPETDSTLNVQFAVVGVVSALEKEEFTELFEANHARIQEQIMLTMHAAEAAELATAGLDLIKRQILEKTNRTLGRPLLREVVFTQLNFAER